MSIARAVLLRASRSKFLENQFRRRAFAKRAVKRFMPGEDVESALKAAEDFAKIGIGTLFTELGEQINNVGEAQQVRDEYFQLLDHIAARKLPSHVSAKPTHVGMTLDPKFCREAYVALAKRAAEIGSFVWIDMEESWYVDDTLSLFRDIHAAGQRVGLAMQSYLYRTPKDVESILDLKPTIRLVKGAYNESKEVAFPKKADTDKAYVEIALQLLNGGAHPVLGTHDLDIVEEIRRRAGSLDGFEVHMLYGIKSGEQRALAAKGVKVKVLISYGEHWFPWYVRRLAERPANVWFVVKNVLG
jgi:proline dehydrogenase